MSDFVFPDSIEVRDGNNVTHTILSGLTMRELVTIELCKGLLSSDVIATQLVRKGRPAGVGVSCAACVAAECLLERLGIVSP